MTDLNSNYFDERTTKSIYWGLIIGIPLTMLGLCLAHEIRQAEEKARLKLKQELVAQGRSYEEIEMILRLDGSSTTSVPPSITPEELELVRILTEAKLGADDIIKIIQALSPSKRGRGPMGRGALPDGDEETALGRDREWSTEVSEIDDELQRAMDQVLKKNKSTVPPMSRVEE